MHKIPEIIIEEDYDAKDEIREMEIKMQEAGISTKDHFIFCPHYDYIQKKILRQKRIRGLRIQHLISSKK